jgi:ABC-type transporter Mla subunit MlaD
MATSSDPGIENQAAQALVRLSAGVLPVWARHLATSRVQSESAVVEMMQAFADIGPHIHRAERQSLQITQALSQSDGGVTGLASACDQAMAPLLQGGQLPEGAADAIARVLQMVHAAVQALENIAKPFNHETQMVAAQVERMYVGFQYQDRISQMMALLEGDIARLQTVVNGQEAVIPEVQSWLADLESHYAMTEQRQDHSGSAGSGNSAADSNETTFF